MASETLDGDIQVLRSGNCTSLSGKTKLRYDIGADTSGAINLRIIKSSGTGYFSTNWVAWERLTKVLDKNGSNSLTSYTLAPLFTGRSVNTCGFLLAVLKAEGLVGRVGEKGRTHERLDPGTFLGEISTLMGVGMPAPNPGPGKAPRAKARAPSKGRPGKA